MNHIYKHNVTVHLDGGKEKIETTKFEVLGINEEYVVLNNDRFTVLQLCEKSTNFEEILEKVYVFDLTNIGIKRMEVYCYTKESDFNKVKLVLSKGFDKWLNKKYGKFNDYKKIIEQLKNVEIIL